MSNTATAMLMLPIAAAVLSHMQNKQDRDKFGLCLMLSLAYSASIGGMATLVGTPPNAIFASLSGPLAETEMSFGRWLMIGLPISAISLAVAWLYMVNVGASIRGMGPISKEKGLIAEQLIHLGRITRDEKAVLVVFAATATAWVTRGLLWRDVIPGIDDSTIVIIAALLLFLIPSKSNRKDNAQHDEGSVKSDDGSDSDGRLMNWRTAITIPWGVLLLIGGGLALANAYAATGLDEWMADKLQFLNSVPFLIVILAIVAVAVLASEIMSNTASAALLIPISASLAASLNIDPILLMVPVTIATSYGFMMPVSTPPNAIVFSSGYVTVPKMVRAGLPLDIIGILLVTALTTLMVPFL
jgi:sodium-dependent dicarboxylate transporter 2/3/5